MRHHSPAQRTSCSQSQCDALTPDVIHPAVGTRVGTHGPRSSFGSSRSCGMAINSPCNMQRVSGQGGSHMDPEQAMARERAAEAVRLLAQQASDRAASAALQFLQDHSQQGPTHAASHTFNPMIAMNLPAPVTLQRVRSVPVISQSHAGSESFSHQPSLPRSHQDAGTTHPPSNVRQLHQVLTASIQEEAAMMVHQRISEEAGTVDTSTAASNHYHSSSQSSKPDGGNTRNSPQALPDATTSTHAEGRFSPNLEPSLQLPSFHVDLHASPEHTPPPLAAHTYQRPWQPRGAPSDCGTGTSGTLRLGPTPTRRGSSVTQFPTTTTTTTAVTFCTTHLITDPTTTSHAIHTDLSSNSNSGGQMLLPMTKSKGFTTSSMEPPSGYGQGLVADACPLSISTSNFHRFSNWTHSSTHALASPRTTPTTHTRASRYTDPSERSSAGSSATKTHHKHHHHYKHRHQQQPEDSRNSTPPPKSFWARVFLSLLRGCAGGGVQPQSHLPRLTTAHSITDTPGPPSSGPSTASHHSRPHSQTVRAEEEGLGSGVPDALSRRLTTSKSVGKPPLAPGPLPAPPTTSTTTSAAATAATATAAATGAAGAGALGATLMTKGGHHFSREPSLSGAGLSRFAGAVTDIGASWDPGTQSAHPSHLPPRAPSSPRIHHSHSFGRAVLGRRAMVLGGAHSPPTNPDTVPGVGGVDGGSPVPPRTARRSLSSPAERDSGVGSSLGASLGFESGATSFSAQGRAASPGSTPTRERVRPETSASGSTPWAAPAAGYRQRRSYGSTSSAQASPRPSNADPMHMPLRAMSTSRASAFAAAAPRLHAWARRASADTLSAHMLAGGTHAAHVRHAAMHGSFGSMGAMTSASHRVVPQAEHVPRSASMSLENRDLFFASSPNDPFALDTFASLMPPSQRQLWADSSASSSMVLMMGASITSNITGAGMTPNITGAGTGVPTLIPDQGLDTVSRPWYGDSVGAHDSVLGQPSSSSHTRHSRTSGPHTHSPGVRQAGVVGSLLPKSSSWAQVMSAARRRSRTGAPAPGDATTPTGHAPPHVPASGSVGFVAGGGEGAGGVWPQTGLLTPARYSTALAQPSDGVVSVHAAATGAATGTATCGNANDSGRMSSPGPGPLLRRARTSSGRLHRPLFLHPDLPAGMVFTLRDFETLHVMSEGYAANVHQAYCNVTQEIVILKTYFLGKLDHTTRRHMHREVSILARCSAHPHIVRLWAAFQEEEHVVLVLEHCDAGDLLRILHKHHMRITPAQAVHKVLVPLLGALQDLHTQGIVHRDIKPANICYTSGGALRLCDFGLAVDTRRQRTHSFMGTRGYIAPELLAAPSPPPSRSGSVRRSSATPLLPRHALHRVASERALDHRGRNTSHGGRGWEAGGGSSMGGLAGGMQWARSVSAALKVKMMRSPSQGHHLGSHMSWAASRDRPSEPQVQLHPDFLVTTMASSVAAPDPSQPLPTCTAASTAAHSPTPSLSPFAASASQACPVGGESPQQGCATPFAVGGAGVRGAQPPVGFRAGRVSFGGGSNTSVSGTGTAGVKPPPPPAAGAPLLTPAADVWAVGIITFQMLCGSAPFPPDQELAKTLREGQPLPALVFPPDVPALARDFIAACLRLVPAERPSCAQLLQHPWVVTTPPCGGGEGAGNADGADVGIGGDGDSVVV